MEIGNVTVGLGQLNNKPPRILQNIASIALVVCFITPILVVPMPTAWLPQEVKTYLIAITSGSGGLLAILERYSGKNQNAPNP